MKYLFSICLLAVCVLASAPATAQVSLGFTGVLTRAALAISSPDVTDSSPRISTGVGIVVHYEMTPALALVFQPRYVGRGATRILDEETAMFGVETDIQLNYVEMPMLATFSFGGTGVRPFIQIGPTIGLLSAATSVGRLDGDEIKLDVKSSFKSLELAALAGIGIELPFGSAHAFVSGQYAHGLTNTWSGGAETIRNRGFHLLFGARFPLGSRGND